MPVIWKMLMVAERRFRRVKSPGLDDGRLTGRSVRGRELLSLQWHRGSPPDVVYTPIKAIPREPA